MNKDTHMLGKVYNRQVLCEGTWHWPNTEKELQEIKRFFDQPRTKMNGGENMLTDLIGDDTLSDDIYDDTERYGKNYDLRITLVKFFNPDEYGKYAPDYQFGVNRGTDLEKPISAWRFILSIPMAREIYNELKRGTDTLADMNF